jgi:hypothetical protein
VIPSSATLTAIRISPAELTVLDSDHGAPIDPRAVERYAMLLRDYPVEDTDPLLVMRDTLGRLRVRNGRHRLLANIRAGRAYVLAMLYEGE